MQTCDPVFEVGPFRFRRDFDWPRKNTETRWGITQGVALDANDRIYIAHTGDPTRNHSETVEVFDADGVKIDAWGKECYGSAHGLEIVKEGKTEYAYLTDQQRGLFKFALDGQLIWHFEKPRLYRKAFGLNWSPSNVATSSQSDLYLSDGYGSAFVVRIDKSSGEEIDIFAGPGTRKRNLYHPHGLAINAGVNPPILEIADNIHNRIVRYDLDGRFIGETLVDDPFLIAPRHLVWHNDFVVMPDLGGHIHFFSASYERIGSIGAPELPFDEQVRFHDQATDEQPPHLFRLPHDVAFDQGGNMYIVEWIKGGRVSKLLRL